MPIRLRVQDYRLLDDAGALDTLGRTELIDGVVFQRSPEFRPHMFVKDELAYRLRRALEDLGSALFVGSGGSVALSEHDMRRPDIILTSEPRGEGAVPLGSIALLVEVSNTTGHFDLGAKVRVCGRRDGKATRSGAKWRFSERIEAVTIEGLAVGTAAI